MLSKTGTELKKNGYLKEEQRRDEVSGTTEPLQIKPGEKQCLENRYVLKNKRFRSKAKDCGGWWSKQRELLAVRLDKSINPCYFCFDKITMSHRKPPSSATIKMVLMLLLPKISILKHNNLCASQLFYYI